MTWSIIFFPQKNSANIDSIYTKPMLSKKDKTLLLFWHQNTWLLWQKISLTYGLQPQIDKYLVCKAFFQNICIHVSWIVSNCSQEERNEKQRNPT